MQWVFEDEITSILLYLYTQTYFIQDYAKKSYAVIVTKWLWIVKQLVKNIAQLLKVVSALS
jgi:hypothetical protein